MSDQTKQQEARSLPATFAKNEFEKDAFILRQLVTKDFKIKYRRSFWASHGRCSTRC